MTLGRRNLPLALAATLAGCSGLAPYPTVPPAGAAAGQRVAICYNGFRSSRAELRAEAQRECPAHTAATFVAIDWRMNHCPLLLPTRATFLCAPKK